MAKYIVSVVMSTCVDIEVEASDEKEAKELAIEEANPFEADDWDYDIDCICRDYDDEEEEEEEI